MKNTKAIKKVVFTPIKPAVFKSQAAARIARPQRVFVKNNSNKLKNIIAAKLKKKGIRFDLILKLFKKVQFDLK